MILHKHLPIVERRNIELTASERCRITDVATSIMAEDMPSGELSYFEPFARPGIGNSPFVFIGDASEIPLLAGKADGAFEYRLSILASEGDLVIIGGNRHRDFENYLEKFLDLGQRDYLQVSQTDHNNDSPAAVRCLKDDETYASLRSLLLKSAGATLIPHITTGTIWALAKRLGEDTGRPLFVVGPPPTLSKLTNNKLWFAKVIRQLLGEGAVPHEVSAYGPALLAARVHSFARGCSKLVVKIPNSAGSHGNFPITSSQISEMGLKELHQHLVDIISQADKASYFPLMVQVWDKDVISSPSAQLWIPLVSDGPPVIEGIFEQHVSESEGRFMGAVAASIPKQWDQKLAREAMMLGHVFQQLGYYGRCSFDTVIFGEDYRSARLHWIECNARWGGVSVPMTFLTQLFKDQPIPAYIIVQNSELGLPYRRFSDGLDLLKDLLWYPGSAKGVIFMTPSGFEDGRSLQFLSLAATIGLAEAQVEMVIQRLKYAH